MSLVKRWILFLVVALLGNFANASLMLAENEAQGMTLTTVSAHEDDCHDKTQHNSIDQHHQLKCHSCCSTLGMYLSGFITCSTLTPLQAGEPPPLPPYTDITYSIYKPPKTVI